MLRMVEFTVTVAPSDNIRVGDLLNINTLYIQSIPWVILVLPLHRGPPHGGYMVMLLRRVVAKGNQ